MSTVLALAGVVWWTAVALAHGVAAVAYAVLALTETLSLAARPRAEDVEEVETAAPTSRIHGQGQTRAIPLPRHGTVTS